MESEPSDEDEHDDDLPEVQVMALDFTEDIFGAEKLSKEEVLIFINLQNYYFLFNNNYLFIIYYLLFITDRLGVQGGSRFTIVARG
jgi:hypothetical protein